jgi:hypothetical protein
VNPDGAGASRAALDHFHATVCGGEDDSFLEFEAGSLDAER